MNNIKKLSTMAMLCAIAYAVTFVIRIPIVPAAPYLTFDPKDVVLAIGGFLYGPLYAFLMSAVVSLIEMITVSSTGFWGCAANILSSCSLICTASFVYKLRKTLGGAIAGLILGVFLVTAVMALWNYVAVPFYQGAPREVVAKMILPVFVPFNLFKSGLNAVLTILLFKPTATALYKAKLLSDAPIVGSRSVKIKWVFVAVSLVVLALILIFALKIFEKS